MSGFVLCSVSTLLVKDFHAPCAAHDVIHTRYPIVFSTLIMRDFTESVHSTRSARPAELRAESLHCYLLRFKETAFPFTYAETVIVGIYALRAMAAKPPAAGAAPPRTATAFGNGRAGLRPCPASQFPYCFLIILFIII